MHAGSRRLGAADHARFWVGEYGRRAGRRFAHALPPVVNEAVVHALEERATFQSLTLGPRLRQSIDILATTHELVGSEPVRIPASDLLPEDVFYFPPIYVHELSGVTLDVDSAVLFAQDWVISESGNSYRWSRDSAFVSGAAVRVRTAEHRRESRPVASVGDLNQHYHLIAETVPQMLRARQIEPDVVFVTSRVPNSTTRTVLDALGFSLEIVPKGQVLDCDRLLFCPVRPVDRIHPADMQLIFDAFLPTGSPPDAGDKVYISRRAARRALDGEERLEAWLSERGFRILLLETMPFGDQVEALARAQTVVAPHGAGLVSTVFMPSGGQVVELATGEWWSQAFRRIAHVRGHEYTLISMSTSRNARWGSGDEAIALLTPLLDKRPGRD